jgi:hypothetical protein
VKTIWLVMPRFPDDPRGRSTAEHCALLNAIDVFSPVRIAGQRVSNEPPTAELILTLEDFEFDCFTLNFHWIVSEKMRRAMALGPSDVQYFSVDSSQSEPLPRSKRYQIMHVPVTEYMPELKTLPYRPSKIPPHPVEPRMPSAAISRREAQPMREIFYDRFRDFIYCTDEFAVRILQSDCSGMDFYDPLDFANGRYRFRTLRGIEEMQWDPTSNSMRGMVIRGIH